MHTINKKGVLMYSLSIFAWAESVTNDPPSGAALSLFFIVIVIAIAVVIFIGGIEVGSSGVLDDLNHHFIALGTTSREALAEAQRKKEGDKKVCSRQRERG